MSTKAKGLMPAASKRTGRSTGNVVRLRPAPARPWVAATGRAIDSATSDRLLVALLSARSFDEACAIAGVSRGDALLARIGDPAFAARWDQAVEARLSEVTTRLADLAIGGLQRGLEPGEDARAAIALGQWLVDGQRTSTSRKRSAGAARPAIGVNDAENQPERPAPGDPEQAARKVDALFATIESRLQAAEALASGVSKARP